MPSSNLYIKGQWRVTVASALAATLSCSFHRGLPMHMRMCMDCTDRAKSVYGVEDPAKLLRAVQREGAAGCC